MEYKGNDLVKCDENNNSLNTDTAAQCLHRCKKTVGCVQFTWFGGKTIKPFKKYKKCCLKNVWNDSPIASDDAISGPNALGNWCFHPPDVYGK